MTMFYSQSLQHWPSL